MKAVGYFGGAVVLLAIGLALLQRSEQWAALGCCLCGLFAMGLLAGWAMDE